jgi:hypothetical protein
MKPHPDIKITFGIIVLNGEPLIEYQLKALYPYAHQIIVVEGASFQARDSAATDGHSIDSTLKIVRRFQGEGDPENKVTLVTAEDDGHAQGFWPGEKDEQSRAYARRATGNILWQVDVDEFYRSEDIEKIIHLLATRPEVRQINLRWKNFWGSVHYTVESFAVERHYHELGGGVPRIFRWGRDYFYKTHRPPTVIDAGGDDLKEEMLPAGELEKLGICIYHYSTIFPGLVQAKTHYHERKRWTDAKEKDWYASNFLRIRRPFRVHHLMRDISWLERFEGEHPPEILRMISDLKAQNRTEGVERRDDVEALLDSKRYQAGCKRFKSWAGLWIVPRKNMKRPRRILARLLENFYSPRSNTALPGLLDRPWRKLDQSLKDIEQILRARRLR